MAKPKKKKAGYLEPKAVDTAATAENSEADVQGGKQPPDPAEVVTRWLREIDAASEHEKDWRDRAEKIVNLYKDERKKAEANGSTRRFNILYANTEVLKGALYQSPPVPDIRRRWLDRDPIGRIAALVLNRAVATAIDMANIDALLKACVQDMVLPGRATARARYKPTYREYDHRIVMDGAGEGVEQDEQGHFRMEKRKEVTFECVELDYVEWDMVRFSPAKRQQKVRWIAYGELLTRDDLIANFGEDIGKEVSLNWSPKGVDDANSEKNAIFKRALVWTVWNKTEKKCIAVCDGYRKAPLKEMPDPLGLEGFFPSPDPLYAIKTNDSMIPTPEYAVYQDHAIDLDALEERISVLQEALRRRGVFDKTFPELEQLAKTGDNKFVGVANYKEFVEKGGLEMALQEQDISNLAAVLVELRKLADQKKQEIYEIIGISDIMRAATDAQETLGAQKLKAQFGSLRTQPRQTEVAMFARDLIRIVAEIIAEHFSPKTLEAMTGIRLALNEQEKALLAATNPQDERVNRPTWEVIMQVIRADKLRGFKVSIETDSTIKPQVDQDQKNRVELLTALSGLFQQLLPAVQMGLIPKKVASELTLFGVRSFPAGAQLEELIDEWANGGVEEMLSGEKPADAAAQQPNPEQVKAEADAAEAQKASAHSDVLRSIEQETAKANLVSARAKAYGEIVKAEALEPGMQLDTLMQEANLKRAEANAKNASAPPAGETLQ